jgi:iron complex outermembrane receptor protein
MPARRFILRPHVIATLLALQTLSAHAQSTAQSTAPSAAQPSAEATTLSTVNVNASADASAEGVPEAYAGGQVARGGRVGILGNLDTMSTPFTSTSYTNELIQDQQAQSVADVLLNDPSVRSARGFGNFQELYVVRGFPVYSDDISYNGLYGMLPRQYIASEFFERVEVLRGANTFLNGAAPAGSGIGGAINLLPKRAPNEPLNRVGFGLQTGGQKSVNFDFARRFGPDDSLGLRLIGARRDGGTGVDREEREVSAMGIGLDWRGSRARLSADVGYQNSTLNAGRPSVTPLAGAPIPRAPDASSNFAQPWTVAKERDTFATLRGEYDITDQVTAWAAGGVRRGSEFNSLANPRVLNAAGDTTASRFDNAREDRISTGEIGLRAKVRTGSVGHTIVASATTYNSRSANAFVTAPAANATLSNLYAPIDRLPAGLGTPSNDMTNPSLTNKVETRSFALADTLAFYDDRVLLTLGLRRQTLEQTSYAYTTLAPSPTSDKTRITPVAGLIFKATNWMSVYGNYIEGLVRGPIAPALTSNFEVSNRGEIFAPYVAKQKEIGAKFDAGRIGGSVAFFHTTQPISGYTPNAVAPGATPTVLFGPYGEQRNRGLEFSVYGEPVRGIRVLGGLTLLDAEQTKTQNGATDGKDVIGVPERQLNIGAEWDIPGVRNLAVNARAVYTSKQFANATNTQTVPSWTRFDLGARYLIDIGNNRTLTMRARIDNLFDRNYWASAGGSPGSNYLVLGAPRTFYVTGTIDF